MFDGGLNAYKKSLMDPEAQKKYEENWEKIFNKVEEDKEDK